MMTSGADGQIPGVQGRPAWDRSSMLGPQDTEKDQARFNAVMQKVSAAPGGAVDEYGRPKKSSAAAVDEYGRPVAGSEEKSASPWAGANAQMRLKLAKTLWGVDEAGDPEKWDALFARIKAEGFEAVESITLTWRADPERFTTLLAKHGLALICQIHTTGGDFVDGEYVYCKSNKLHEHLASFVALTREAAALKPVLINSHSGHDSWGAGPNALAFFKHALKVEETLGVPVVHETHRQRLLYTPYQAAELLAHPDLAALKINADLSHWCCVCEHVFDATDPRDDWWPATLAAVARHCAFVHCRVGHAEGPQVSEPDAPEFATEVAAHCGWWREIWAAQACRGEAAVWAEPEHGPPPYLQTLPYSQKPVADLWEVNSRVAARVRAEFGEAMARVRTEAAGAAGGQGGGGGKKGGGGKAGGGGAAATGAGAGAGAGAAEATAANQAAGKDVAGKGTKEAKAREKALKAAVKEGGKKGVEIEGASDMGGLEFFCTTIEAADGDLELLSAAMSAMNAQPEPDAEDRKGCSGHVGKMIFSAGVEQLALVAYVPADKEAKVGAVEWVAHVLGAVGGRVMASPLQPADSPQGGSLVQAVVAADADAGRFPLKDKDAGMAAAFSYLRAQGAFPAEEDDDDDECAYGDDAFEEMGF